MKNQDNLQSAQVYIEIGHRAWCRDPAFRTPDATHEWVLFVRGKDGNEDIHHFIEKVVFHLHESFKKPIQTVKDPPYRVSEYGYGIFLAKIEVHFRMKDKGVESSQSYNYDVTLPDVGKDPIELAVTEKLTFNDVSDDFIQKVLEGGGNLIEDHSSNVLKPTKTVYNDSKAKIRKHKKYHENNYLSPNTSSSSKICSKEIEKRQLEMSIFGTGPPFSSKRIKSENSFSPYNSVLSPTKISDNDLVLDKRKFQEYNSSKIKNSKSSIKMASSYINKDARSDLMVSGLTDIKKPAKSENYKKEKIEYCDNKQTKASLFPVLQNSFRDTHGTISPERKMLKVLSKVQKTDCITSSSEESDSEHDKETREVTNNQILEYDKDIFSLISNDENLLSLKLQKKNVLKVQVDHESTLSGLSREDLRFLYDKITSLKEDEEEGLIFLKIYRILCESGKAFGDDEMTFDLCQLDLETVHLIQEILSV